MVGNEVLNFNVDERSSARARVPKHVGLIAPLNARDHPEEDVRRRRAVRGGPDKPTRIALHCMDFRTCRENAPTRENHACGS